MLWALYIIWSKNYNHLAHKKRRRSFLIKANLLITIFSSFQTYILTLTAAMASDISLATTGTIELKVESSLLIAIIKGTKKSTTL